MKRKKCVFLSLNGRGQENIKREPIESFSCDLINMLKVEARSPQIDIVLTRTSKMKDMIN